MRQRGTSPRKRRSSSHNHQARLVAWGIYAETRGWVGIRHTDARSRVRERSDRRSDRRRPDRRGRGCRAARPGSPIFGAQEQRLAPRRSRGAHAHADVRCAWCGSRASSLTPASSILAVKAHQIAPALSAVENAVAGGATLLTLQNGIPWWYFLRAGGEFAGRTLRSVDHDGVLASRIDAKRIVGCIAYPAAELVEPGLVRHVEGDRFPIGELDGSRSARCTAISALLERAGFRSPVLDDVRSEIWVKAWGTLAFNPVSALTGMTMAEICRSPDTRALVVRMMTETREIAARLGVTMRVPAREASPRRRARRGTQDVDAAGPRGGPSPGDRGHPGRDGRARRARRRACGNVALRSRADEGDRPGAPDESRRRGRGRSSGRDHELGLEPYSFSAWSRFRNRLRFGLAMQEVLDRLARFGVVIYPYYFVDEPVRPRIRARTPRRPRVPPNRSGRGASARAAAGAPARRGENPLRAWPLPPASRARAR